MPLQDASNTVASRNEHAPPSTRKATRGCVVSALYARPTLATRLTETAREAGATDPEQLGEQLALLLDGASARSRVLDTSTFATAAAVAAVLIDTSIPTAGAAADAGNDRSSGTGPHGGAQRRAQSAVAPEENS